MSELNKRLTEMRDELKSLLNKSDDEITPDEANRADELVIEIRETTAQLEKQELREKALADAEARMSIALQAEVKDAGTEERSAPQVQIMSEERTYSRDAERRHGRSFIADVVNAQLRGNWAAAERLQRHMQEEAVELRGLDGLESRDVGTGAFAGLTVPQYLTDLVALPKRPMRPLADACRQLPLPADGMTVNISRGTTATAAAVQATENSGVQETDYDDTLLTVNVRTIAGQQDVSMQAVQRSTGADAVIVQDLINAYQTKLDDQIINGDGNSGAHLGILSTSSIVSVTYTDASPTAAEAYPKLFDLISQIQSGVYAGATHLVMHPRRWNWFASQVGTSFPFLQPAGTMATNVGGEITSNTYGGVVGVLAGLPVLVDANVPTNLGGGTEDPIIGITADELFLWEDTGAPMLIRAEQTAAGNLTVKLVVYGFSAFTAGRYPGAHGKITGTGLVTPTF